MTDTTSPTDEMSTAVTITITDEAWETLWGHPRLLATYVLLLRQAAKDGHPLSAYVFDLADELGVSRSTITKNVGDLVDLGLVERKSQYENPHTGEVSSEYNERLGFYWRAGNTYTITDMTEREQ